MTDTGISGVGSRRLALVLVAVSTALVLATLVLALPAGYPTRLLPGVGFSAVTAFVFPGLALSLLVDAAVLAMRERRVTLNELTVLRVVGVFAAITLASGLLEGLWVVPGLEVFFLGVYVTMGALAILVFFALVATVEISVQTFRARRPAPTAP